MQATTENSRLTIAQDRLLLEGAPFRILSGAMHYFRTIPEQWSDRLTKLKAMGLNTIETYVAWNLHEPTPGRFTFDGLADLPEFLRQIESLGLKAIVRPGPYICAEWEFGGLPAWLLADQSLHLRASCPRFLSAVDRYFDALMARLMPFVAEAGGPIIAMQVENEYGSYGQDKAYLAALAQGLRQRGYQGLLFTSDGPEPAMLANGTLPGPWKTVNFGSRPREAFDELRKHEAGPLMCMEFWNGWFDHWGETHHTRAAADAVAVLDEMLTLGAHVNIYMAHGGTNFGFWNGANTDEAGRFQPTVTSYDYDAPLTEDGRITPKFHAYQKVLRKHGAEVAEIIDAEVASCRIELRPLGAASLFGLLDRFDDPIPLLAPQPMEAFGQNRGYALYETDLQLPPGEVQLDLQVHDRALVFLDAQLAGELWRDDPRTLPVTVTRPQHRLSLLVENMGRVNYGKHLADRKGIIGPVWADRTELLHWTARPLPLEHPPEITQWHDRTDLPAFVGFEFEISEPADLFLGLPDWGKGQAYVNGFNLGRYWDRGPQDRLYVPRPLLRPGRNLVTLFETRHIGRRPVLGP